ncbi:AAA family ATPase [Aeromonas caviae]|uniref:AAA family ATPase n=1 Tax=Aeromonas caviae TaxID=648 RepID=UPI00244A3635|nr:AAA family ATPase [Aeromonas caviae]MDH1221118.1 ATP-binding protein [Aeromonas caviae]
MRIGICGAHRTGKTTLARALAESTGLTLMDAGVSAVFRELGLEPSRTLSFADRMKVQDAILAKYLDLMAGAENVVIDRTPIDFIGYLLADLNQDHYQEEGVSQWVVEYIERCIQAARQTMSLIIFVSPGIPLEMAEGKGLVDPGYIRGVNWLMRGALVDSGVTYGYLPPSYTDLDMRREWVEAMLQLRFQFKALKPKK